MSFDWQDYVALAQELADRPEEACLRSAVSRAYYGVFCIARNLKGLKEHTPKNLHWSVIEEYRNSSNREDREIGSILDKLRRARNHADYREDKPVTKGIAERAVLLAKDILTKMRSHLRI